MIEFAYGATKVALDKLTIVLATSFAERGVPIRVNSLQPGAFMTEQLSAEFMEELKTKPVPGQIAPIPARRLGT